MQPAVAAEWPKPDAAYSAQRIMDAGGMQINGQIYHDQGKERWESNTGGMSMVRIMRPDLGKLLMYMPQMNMAMEMPLDGGANFAGPSVDYDGPEPEAIGRETMGGEPTTKFQTQIDDGGSLFTMTAWVTDDGIVMRMEGQGGEGTFAMYLEGLSRGPQDAALFELPAGAQVMPANPALLEQFR
ncbi:MAG: hypothetical protein ACTSX7_03740 [Alphaproteobacteria bacterium]